MKLNFEILGLKKIEARLEKYPEDIRAKASDVVVDGTLAIWGEARKSIQAVKSKGEPRGDGSFYSKPNFPPNTDTGRLVKSIEFNIDKEKAFGEVGTNLEYGKHLEFGTSDMRPRPWLAPAYGKFADKIKGKLKKALKGVKPRG